MNPGSKVGDIFKIGLIFGAFLCARGMIMGAFSTAKLASLRNFNQRAPEFVAASDGAKLAYYAFVPAEPKTILIFYHGAGFYGGAVYQYFAQQLSDKFGVGCYVFDIRGHGHSEGKRGDAPSVNQVFDDVTTAIELVNRRHPGVPVYIGGHSSGAGMILNYSAYKHHSLVTGYIFISPYLGINSGANKKHADPSTSFIKHVQVWKFIVNGITGGYLCGHSPAVYFNYPEELVKQDKYIVTAHSVTMTQATSPDNPQDLFAHLNKPCCIVIGQQDEQFVPEKVAEYGALLPQEARSKSVVRIIPDAAHLDIMLGVADTCAEFMGL